MSTTKPDVYSGMVLARGRGYYADKIQEPGERFYYTGVLGDWMMTPEQEAEAKAADEARAALLAQQQAETPEARESALQSRLAALEAREKALADAEAAAAKKK